MFEKEAFITLYIYILLFPKIYYFHRAACNQHFSLAYPIFLSTELLEFMVN